MQSERCEEDSDRALERMGYQFFDSSSSAALKPCMWCKRALKGGEMCYKNQFYGIESHRCAQITPTLKCNQKCLFCWRPFEHEYSGTAELPPETIVERLDFYQRKALAGYKVSYRVDPEMFEEAIHPNQVAISLSGEPTLYSRLPELIDLLNERGTTFLVSNGTMPDMLRKCRPYQKYVSLTAPDRETYLKVANPDQDYWDNIQESLSELGSCRSAIRVTLVKGINDYNPESYAKMVQNSGATFVEVKGYMHVGYSQHRLTRAHMPEHDEVVAFAREMLENMDYKVKGENLLSRVICLEQS